MTTCVIPSIADGMSQCSWNSASGAKYLYNMRYILQNKDKTEYYEGIVKLDSRDGKVVSYNGNVAMADSTSAALDEHTTIDTFFLNLNFNLETGVNLEAN